MTAIPKPLRMRINRAAHDQALRHEMHLRDTWTAELLDAIARNVTHDALQAIVADIEMGYGGRFN